MPSTAVRVPSGELELIQKWANERKTTPGKVIAELVREHEEKMFWAQMHEDVERLRSDPVAWKDYQDEVRFFEGGSMDGLENEPPYFTPEEAEAIRAEHERTKGR